MDRRSRSHCCKSQIARIALCLLMCFATTANAAFVNRRVSDVLDELRGSGFVFIYSTHVIPPQLRIRAEPLATDGIELAREILAEHGLVLIEAAPKVFSIARAPKSRTAAIDTAPAAPVEEVVVQTSRYEFNNYLENASFLTQEQLKDLPKLADETLRAVQRLPGSATNGFSSVGPVRGGEPGEIAIVLDGLRLYEPFHLKNFLSPVSLLDSRLVEGIEFYSGGFPTVFGDRMSAVIDARTVHPGPPRYFELGFNLFHASGLASLAFDAARGHALISARRSNVGDLAQFSETDFGEPNYQDGFARIDYDFTAQTSGTFEVLVSSDEIVALRANEMQRAHAEYRNVYAWTTLQHAWSDAANSRAVLSYTDLSNSRDGRIDEPTRAATVLDERNFHVFGLRLENSLDTRTLRHRFGIEARRLWGEYDYSSDVSWAEGAPLAGSPPLRLRRDASPKPEGYETLAYWDVRADLAERWTFQGGVRVDTQTYDGSGDGEQWSPRLSVLYALAAQSHLRASWGRFHQAQGINELQVEDGIDRFHPAQYADHLIVGFDHAFAAGLDLRIEAYQKRYRRLNPRFENMFDPLALFPEAEADRVMIDPDSAEAVGVEALLRLRQHGPWSGWISYTWSNVEDRIDGQDIARSWDQRHAVGLGVAWSKGPWTVALTNIYHSGWPTTQLVIDTSSTIPRLSTDVRNRSRFTAFNSLDLRATRLFALSRGVLDVYVEITNATSRENPCCVEYGIASDASGTRVYSRNIDSWLPLVPSAGVLWRY